MMIRRRRRIMMMVRILIPKISLRFTSIGGNFYSKTSESASSSLHSSYLIFTKQYPIPRLKAWPIKVVLFWTQLFIEKFKMLVCGNNWYICTTFTSNSQIAWNCQTVVNCILPAQQLGQTCLAEKSFWFQSLPILGSLHQPTFQEYSWWGEFRF